MQNISKTYLSEEFWDKLDQYGFTLATMLNESTSIEERIVDSIEWKFKIIFFERKGTFFVYILMFDWIRWIQARNPNHILNPSLNDKAWTSYISNWNQSFLSKEETEIYYKTLLDQPIEFESTTSSEWTLYFIKWKIRRLL